MKYLLTFFIVLLSACRPKLQCDHQFITLQNNSTQTLYVSKREFRNGEKDTTIRNNRVDPKSAGYISFSDSDYYKLSSLGIDSKIISNPFKKGCLSEDFYHNNDYGIVIFFIDSSKIYSLSWDTVKYYNMFEKRVVLYGKELDSMAWKVSYP